MSFDPAPATRNDKSMLLSEMPGTATQGGGEAVLDAGGSASGRYSRNVLVVGLSLFVSAASGLLLPSYLAHHLAPALYGGWILILQVAGYVGVLDFGMQTAIAKYMAQHTAASDASAVNQHASAGTAITVVSGAVGLILSAGLALLVPWLFRDMPAPIAGQVVEGVLVVGMSTAFLLACSSFAAFFRGLQRYKIPTFSAILNKLGSVLFLVVLVSGQRGLRAMGLSVAVLNILTGIGQVIAWRKLLHGIKVRVSLLHWPIVKQMLSYCAVLGVWTSGMLIITGLDLTIVGHFDFGATPFYAIAATPITFLILMLQAALNPLMPAVSALSVSRSPQAMGEMLARSTRYVTLLLELAGLPLLLFGYTLLLLWVGPVYAERSLAPMRLLILAQMIRNLCAPYATMVIATGTQRAATVSTLCEAGTNLFFSILLAKFFGAIGVATGTLIGAIIGVMVHFFVSMRQTRSTFNISPGRLFETGILRPGMNALPTLFLLPWFWRATPTLYTLPLAALWAVASFTLGWRFSLNPGERGRLLQKLQGLVPNRT